MDLRTRRFGPCLSSGRRSRRCRAARCRAVRGPRSAAWGAGAGRGSGGGPEAEAGGRAGLRTWMWGLRLRPWLLRNERADHTASQMNKWKTAQS